MGFSIQADYRTVKATKGRPKKVLKTWMAACYDARREPKRVRFSLQTKNEGVARQRLLQIERDYAMKVADPWRRRPKFRAALAAEAVEGFLRSRTRKGLRPKTIQTYREVLTAFVASLPPGALIGAVGADAVAAYADRPGLSEASKRSYRRHIGVFLRWCAAEGMIDAAPEVAKGRGRATKAVAEFLTRAEYDRLLRVIEEGTAPEPGHKQKRTFPAPWLANVVRFATFTGLRRGEVCHLRWEHVDPDTGYVAVKNTEHFRSKSGHERRVYLAGEARTVIDRKLAAFRAGAGGRAKPEGYVFEAPTGGRLREDYLTKRFRQFRKAAGLAASISFHNLRHTFGSWAAANPNMSIYQLQKIMGHSDVSVTAIYAHLRPEHQKAAMEAAFGVALATEPRAEEGQGEVERLRAEVERLRSMLASPSEGSGELAAR